MQNILNYLKFFKLQNFKHSHTQSFTHYVFVCLGVIRLLWDGVMLMDVVLEPEAGRLTAGVCDDVTDKAPSPMRTNSL